MTQTVKLAHDRSDREMRSSFSRRGMDDLAGFPDSLRSLITSLSSTNQITSKQVAQSLKEANISPRDLQNWAAFDHAVTDSYGRKLVYDGGYFEVMVMSWLPGDISAIHDHGQTQWGAVQCFGRGLHTAYRFIDGVLSIESEETLEPAQILSVNHSLVHQMSNYSQSPFFSLHVYGCYDKQDIITGDARVFDLLEGRVQHTNGGVFFCLPESEIVRRGGDLKADRLTTLRHHQQMHSRIVSVILHDSSDFRQDLNYWQSKLALVEKKIEELSATFSVVW